MATRQAATTVPAPPGDVRLMNTVASTVFVLAGVALLAAAVGWLSRLPAFTLRAIEVRSELLRSNVATLRANALPKLAGNFFSIDLARAREAFEAVPWVREAVVQRVWPDKLAVRLREYQAVALWEGDDGNDRLVDDDGTVFEANVGDVEDEALPRLAGPEDSAPRMLALYRQLVPLFAKLDTRIETLRLSSRDSWRVALDNGAEVELGRGDADGNTAELLARCERFARTLPQVSGRFPHRPLQYADLRHADGYAVRIQGVTTGVPTPANPAASR
jgi:cell division protein FtsQ